MTVIQSWFLHILLAPFLENTANDKRRNVRIAAEMPGRRQGKRCPLDTVPEAANSPAVTPLPRGQHRPPQAQRPPLYPPF